LGLLTILIFAATIAAVAQIFWFRAGSVQEIPEGPFTVIPVFSVLLRAIGEMYACVITAAGLVLCLSIWIAKGAGGLPFIPLPGVNLPSNGLFENTFFQGLVLLVLTLLLAAAYLLFFYFIAEAIVVGVDIAVNVRALLRTGSPRRHWHPNRNMDLHSTPTHKRRR
jgi:hypothetical protein